jgi:hypothetical protein
MSASLGLVEMPMQSFGVPGPSTTGHLDSAACAGDGAKEGANAAAPAACIILRLDS